MLRRTLQAMKRGQSLLCLSRLNVHTSTFPVYSRFDKDLPYPNLPTPISKVYSSDTDILLDQLKKSKSLERTLELINLHLDVMNSKHVVQSFESIHTFIKLERRITEHLVENTTFQALCSRLMKVIRLFEPQEVVIAYKVLCELPIKSNTYIMQSVLKMLGAHLNNMNLGQLIFLNFLLHKQVHSALVDGLRLALPLVLQVQIEQQLDSENIVEVVNCLQLACRAKLRSATIEKIIKAAIEKASVLPIESAVTVIFALLNLETPVDGYKELLNAAFEVLCKNVDTLNRKKIVSILRLCRNQGFYHPKFLFRVADYIISKNWNLENTYLVVSYCCKLDFAPSNLLDYFANAVCTESGCYKTNNLILPLNCIEYLTATSYHPVRVDEAARLLYSHEEKLESLFKSPNLLVKFLSCLAMLGHFPQALLSKALDEDFLFHAWSCSKKQGRSAEFEQNILSLLWALDVYNEQKNFNIPVSISNKFIQSVYQRHMNSDYPLAKFIENGLGGPEFLQSGIFTHDGHVIDHIIAMRSGNYPVSLQNMKSEKKEHSLYSLKFAEDYFLPEDAKIIAVIVAQEEHYLRDPEILKGWMDLKIRSLAKKKYSTVVINHVLWKNLPDREKIPFLMHEIKEAIPDNSVLKSTCS